MAMNVKTRDAETNAAILKFLEDGGRVKLRGVNEKTVKAATWQGSKVTCGFNPKQLRDQDGK